MSSEPSKPCAHLIDGWNKSPTSARFRTMVGRSFLACSFVSLCFHDLLATLIPDGYGLVEIRVVRQVASDGGVVAEHFIFYDRLAGSDRVVEISLVIDCVAVAVRHGVAFAFIFRLPVQSFRFRMVFVPLLQILIAQSFRPAED